jgi:DNA modification methylase
MSLAPASPSPDVWHDITRMRTLNSEQSQRRLVKHICPLQLEIVERLIERYSNPGEEVTDPFGGLLTVPYCAIRLGRRGHASELNPQSWRDGLRYLKAAETERDMPTLFDLMKAGA